MRNGLDFGLAGARIYLYSPDDQCRIFKVEILSRGVEAKVTSPTAFYSSGGIPYVLILEEEGRELYQLIHAVLKRGAVPMEGVKDVVIELGCMPPGSSFNALVYMWGGKGLRARAEALVRVEPYTIVVDIPVTMRERKVEWEPPRFHLKPNPLRFSGVFIRSWLDKGVVKPGEEVTLHILFDGLDYTGGNPNEVDWLAVFGEWRPEEPLGVWNFPVCCSRMLFNCTFKAPPEPGTYRIRAIFVAHYEPPTFFNASYTGGWGHELKLLVKG